MSAKYQIIYWRDIPSQIKVKTGRKRQGKPLTERFLQSIDAASMKSGDTDSSAYLEEWRQTEWAAVEGDATEFIDALAAKIEADYSGKRLSNLVKNGGWEPKDG